MISSTMIKKRHSISTDDDDIDCNENAPIIQKIKSTRKKSYRKWTKEEDDRLREFMNMNNTELTDWSCVSKHVGNSRTDAQCQHRWERFLDPSITKGPWTDEEDKKVIELVRDYGAKHWSLIAKELKGRIGKQCRERWHNHLNPMINKNPWTNDENLRLFVLHQHFGNKWAEIAKYFNGRSDNSIKNHWNSSMRKKFHLEVENLKRQGLDWTALIPPDFSWPKIDQINSDHIPHHSSRTPLSVITNCVRSSTDSSKIIKIENSETKPNSNDNQQHPLTILSEKSQSISSTEIPIHRIENNSSENFDDLFFYGPSSPIKPTSIFSNNLFTSNEYIPLNDHQTHSPFKTSSFDTNLLSFDDVFSIKYHDNRIISPTNISSTSSPSKYRVLNTPERPHLIDFTSSPQRDCFNDYLPISLDNYSLNNVQNATYTEILTGQTYDQRCVTEQARRYLSCSSLLNS